MARERDTCPAAWRPQGLGVQAGVWRRGGRCRPGHAEEHAGCRRRERSCEGGKGLPPGVFALKAARLYLGAFRVLTVTCRSRCSTSGSECSPLHPAREAASGKPQAQPFPGDLAPRSRCWLLLLAEPQPPPYLREAPPHLPQPDTARLALCAPLSPCPAQPSSPRGVATTSQGPAVLPGLTATHRPAGLHAEEAEVPPGYHVDAP